MGCCFACGCVLEHVLLDLVKRRWAYHVCQAAFGAAGLSPPTSRLRLRGVRERRAASAMASAPERGGARKLPVLDTVVTRRFRVRLSHSPRGHIRHRARALRVRRARYDRPTDHAPGRQPGLISLYHTAVSLLSYSMRCFVSFMLHDDAILRRMFISHNINLNRGARTGHIYARTEPQGPCPGPMTDSWEGPRTVGRN